jgi:hypothetical protein
MPYKRQALPYDSQPPGIGRRNANLHVERYVSRAPLGCKIGVVLRRYRIPEWRATVDEDGHYCFAVAL